MGSPSPTLRRFFDRLFWFLSGIPLGQLVLFYGFVLCARLSLGYWPTPYHPDPKDVDIYLYYEFLCYSMFAVPLSFFLFTPLVLRFRTHFLLSRRSLVGIVLYFAGLTAWIMSYYFDPGRYWEWFFD